MKAAELFVRHEQGAAFMGNAPLVVIAGQASTHRLHEESHQMLDMVQMFQPITKYAMRLLTPNTIPLN